MLNDILIANPTALTHSTRSISAAIDFARCVILRNPRSVGCDANRYFASAQVYVKVKEEVERKKE